MNIYDEFFELVKAAIGQEPTKLEPETLTIMWDFFNAGILIQNEKPESSNFTTIIYMKSLAKRRDACIDEILITQSLQYAKKATDNNGL